MKGAPLSPDLLNHLDNLDFDTKPFKSEKAVINLSATKTAFQATKIFRDFEYKKDNLMKNIKS